MSRQGPEPTNETQTSASAADTVPTIQHQRVQSPEIKPERLPLAPAQAPEKSETMPPSRSQKEKQVHSQPPSHSRSKNQTRTGSKPLSPSKASPRSSVASNKSPPASGKASPSQDASKPSSPAVAAAATRSRIASKPPSPSQTSSRNDQNSKPTSQSRLKADSQPSSSSQSGLPPQASSMSRSPSQANSQKQPSKITSRVQSPSHSSSKPTAQSTSQQRTASLAANGDQTTNGIISHPANHSPEARPKSRESQLQRKSKQSPKPNLKPVESKESENQPQTKEDLTSKNTSNPHLNQQSSENPTQSDQTIENGLEPSIESQAESKENEETKNDKEDLAKTTNTSPNSTLITSSESSSPFEPEDRNSQKKETMEGISKAFQKLNIKYSDAETPESFITLLGDNKGASMQLLSGKAKRESSIHIHREYKSNPDQSPKSSTDIEENFNHKTPKDSRTEEDPPLKLYINNNLQGINNSILSNTSFSERNPGIKLKFFGEPTKSEDKSECLHTQKANYTAKPAERLTYEPTVRRRCLRGLFMESSDSEIDNPEKPRRHGCRYSSCKGKEVEIMEQKLQNNGKKS